MNKIKQWLRYRYNSVKNRKLARVFDYACELYQIQEYDGKLWLTFNANFICPCDMLKDDALDTLTKIRQMYVERQK